MHPRQSLRRGRQKSISPSRQLFSKVESVLGHAFEWIYPLQRNRLRWRGVVAQRDQPPSYWKGEVTWYCYEQIGYMTLPFLASNGGAAEARKGSTCQPAAGADCQTLGKLRCCVCGTNVSTLERDGAHSAHQFGDMAHPIGYRGTSLMRNSASVGPYSRNVPRALWWSLREGLFLMSEVPL